MTRIKNKKWFNKAINSLEKQKEIMEENKIKMLINEVNEDFNKNYLLSCHEFNEKYISTCEEFEEKISNFLLNFNNEINKIKQINKILIIILIIVIIYVVTIKW